MKQLVIILALLAMSAGAFALRTGVPLGAAPGHDDTAKFGNLPVQTGKDGSTMVDPNALGIGPEGVTQTELDPATELAQTLAAIPPERKLTLAGGTVVGVVGNCSFPDNYDPDSKCIGLHELTGLSTITIGRQGETIGQVDRSPASTQTLRDLLADQDTKEYIVDYLNNASADWR